MRGNFRLPSGTGQKGGAGEDYERELRQEVVRLSLLSQPGVPKDIMERVAKRMTLEELKAFQKAYRQESGKLATPRAQLGWGKLRERYRKR